MRRVAELGSFAVRAMSAEDSNSTSERPWVTRGICSSEHEDYLIGNRAGFELLKVKVDDALKTGECRVEEGGVQFVGIRVLDQDPRIENADKPGGFKDGMRLLGCGVVAFVLITVFLAGLLQIWSWMK